MNAKKKCPLLYQTEIIAALLVVAFMSVSLVAQKPADDPVKKLGAFLGKWQTEGTFSRGGKVHSELECRWSPQNGYLICEQQVTMGTAVTRQLTVYSYNASKAEYGYASFQGDALAPSVGVIQINGNEWLYSSSVENNGKKTLVRTTNEFTDPKTEVFKVMLSDDGGVIWKPVLQGAAHKVTD
jgi:hypothetical protein